MHDSTNAYQTTAKRAAWHLVERARTHNDVEQTVADQQTIADPLHDTNPDIFSASRQTSPRGHAPRNHINNLYHRHEQIR